MTLWFGHIPNICGRGISVISGSREGAMKSLRKRHSELMRQREKDGLPPMPEIANFNDSIDYFGGCVREIEMDRAYNDDFGD